MKLSATHALNCIVLMVKFGWTCCEDIPPTHGSCTEVLHSSYTMGTQGLPDIYTLSTWACGPWALGVYIRQTTRAHGITIKINKK